MSAFYPESPGRPELGKNYSQLARPMGPCYLGPETEADVCLPGCSARQRWGLLVSEANRSSCIAPCACLWGAVCILKDVVSLSGAVTCPRSWVGDACFPPAKGERNGVAMRAPHPGSPATAWKGLALPSVHDHLQHLHSLTPGPGSDQWGLIGRGPQQPGGAPHEPLAPGVPF